MLHHNAIPGTRDLQSDGLVTDFEVTFQDLACYSTQPEASMSTMMPPHSRFVRQDITPQPVCRQLGMEGLNRALHTGFEAHFVCDGPGCLQDLGLETESYGLGQVIAGKPATRYRVGSGASSGYHLAPERLTTNPSQQRQ